MKKITRTLSVLLAALLLMSMLSVSSFAATKNPFKDINKKDWFYNYVLSLNADGIVNGKTATTYAPNDNVTRAEFVKMLGAISMVDATKFTPEGLSDVKKKDWFAGFVAWALKNGVTKGTSKTTFAPNNNITRQDMATMIYRFAEANAIPLGGGKAVTFKDAKSIASYAKAAVTAMQQAGIINGIKSGDGYLFNPTALATRAEAAKLLCVLFDIIKSSGRYQSYQLLKKDLPDNATGKTADGYPLFEMEINPGEEDTPIYRLYLSTENGTERLHLEVLLPIDIYPDLNSNTSVEGALVLTVALSAIDDSYEFFYTTNAADTSLDFPAAIMGGKIAEFGPDHLPELIDIKGGTEKAKTTMREQFEDPESTIPLEMGSFMMELLILTNSLDGDAPENGYLYNYGFDQRLFIPSVA